MKALRWLGIVVALLLVIVLAIPFLINVNQFRPRLETALTQALGREVKLGDLKLSILSGSVEASDLDIADDAAYSKTPFVRAKSLKVGVELEPLIFSKKLNVTGIEIQEPEIALVQSDAGVWNFASLGNKTQAQPAAAESSTSSSPPMQDLTVKLVKITNGRLSLKTAGEPQLKVLQKVNVEIKDFAANAV
ncbi:MAG TPA: AsmA family protein, partial [Bryobacteraceae bacterium]|nr:AsmA family protein [Bryobacteraceae bacterium]